MYKIKLIVNGRSPDDKLDWWEQEMGHVQSPSHCSAPIDHLPSDNVNLHGETHTKSEGAENTFIFLLLIV